MSAEDAREIIDGERFMTLATAGADGTPWASPVWYAPDGPSELLWVSSPQARHSRNLAARPEVAIVIFDSTQRPGDVRAVYMAGRAEEVDADRIAVFSARSVAQGLPEWTADAVRAPAKHRLYRAVVHQHWVLGAHDERVPVTP